MLTLHKYNPEYVELFQNERNKLSDVLNNTCLIEHIGSTAIPEVDGKGVIDIMLVFNYETDVMPAIKLLENAGYSSSADNIKRNGRIFMSSSGQRESSEGDIHLHLLLKDNIDYPQAIMFRNYLIENREARLAYNSLKYGLLKNVNNRQEYTKLKDSFIKNIINLQKDK